MTEAAKLTKDELIAELEWLIKRLKENDSYEGSLEYTAAEFEVFEVRAALRFNNKYGQGSIRIISSETWTGR